MKGKISADMLLSPFDPPVLDDLSSPEAIRTALLNGFRYYGYSSSSKDAKSWCAEWVKKNLGIKEAKYVRNIPDGVFPATVGFLCRMLLDGLPYDESYGSRIKGLVRTAREDYPLQQDVDDGEPVKSVYERMVENMRDWMGEYVEGEIDDMHLNKGASDFSLAELLEEHKIPAKSAMLVADAYRDDKEIYDNLLSANPDPEYVEAYPYGKRYLKKAHAFYTMLVEDAEHHANKAKAVRKTRKKRASKIAKVKPLTMKYKASDDDLKLVSKAPDAILGCTQAWVYNAKKRILYHVVSMAGETFGVKGDTIQNVDIDKSVGKKLRHPDKVLPDFTSYNKTKLKGLLKSLTTKECGYKGRMNADMLILKVIK